MPSKERKKPIARAPAWWYAVSVLAGLACLALDQWVKRWVSDTLPLDQTAPLWPGIVELRTVHNYGAAWSSFSGMRWMLTLATSAIVLWMMTLLLRKRVRHPVGVLACCVVSAGGLGNILDRVRLGYVVDMFCFQFIEFPVFNVADICINIGCALGVIYYILYYDREGERENGDGTEESPPG